MTGQGIIGIDGHDGAGKTTLAKALADRLNGSYLRPLGGKVGERLMRAYAVRDHAQIIEIGEGAISDVLDGSSSRKLRILDRSWITICSLVPLPLFEQRWTLWIPTVLCWSDLPTTLHRLSQRQDEIPETVDYHRHFIALYRECAVRRQCPVLRTDHDPIAPTLDRLEQVVLHLNRS